MSAEDRDDKDPLQSLIADILEAENRGETIDRESLLTGHPEHAESLRDFFATHDQMKSAAEFDPELNDQRHRRAMFGWALGISGALLIGAFIFMVGYAAGWGKDSIGAGLVIGILSPAAFLGAIAVSSVLYAWSLARKSILLACASFLFSSVVAASCLYLYFSNFIPFVDGAINAGRAWRGHPLPVWWYVVSGLLGILSVVVMAISFSLSSGVLSTQKSKRNVKTS